MAARAMWKAELAIGAETVPVKLYAAIEERKVHFRLLDAARQAPVQQQMIAEAADGEVVVERAVRKGIRLDEGLYAIVTPEELAALAPKESRTITVERFVPPGAVAGLWYDRPYWLGPDGDAGAYFALVQALREAGRVGVARWVMRKKRYHGALRVEGDHLALVRMRNAEEVVPATTLEAPGGRAPDAREIALAEQLVAALEGPFDPNDFEGTYDDRVRELIEAKLAGKVVALPKARRKAATREASIADALEASLKAVGGGRGA